MAPGVIPGMAPFAPHPFSEPANNRRIAAIRFALALAGSAGMHAWLAGWLVVDSTRPAGRSAVTRVLEARIAMVERPVAVEPSDPAVPPRPRAQAAEGDRKARPAAARENRLTANASPPALPAAADPVYYDVRDLDVYPRPVVPLDLARLVAGRHRFTLLIDEAGRVTAVDGGQSQGALRAALTATRFHPAFRGGRAVRSRVQLEFDPVEAAGNSR